MVRSNSSAIDRRSFLKTAAPFALGVCAVARGQIPIERGRFSEPDVPRAREQLLKLVNEERLSAGLSQLQLDDLASRVASAHALDMAKGGFLSHWGSDGRKPYHRYSFAGGTDAVQENVSSAQSIPSVTPAGVARDLHEMHQAMIEEAPPNDGHRKTILLPQLTHVGFGIAMQDHNLRLDELYLARYIEMEPIPRQVKPKTTVTMRGRVLNRKHVLTNADVFFEPLPSPPAIDWLREPRSYGLPEDFETILPKLPPPYSYADGSTGSIELRGSGRFQTRVNLSRKSGINTIVMWLKTSQNGTGFPATAICVRVE
ncbi:MAG TPA: CAP domain-containing protein [Pyrinomonadaceae bacterium]|nr:CAP domain-containing protein [Pyrinomonadaceae bacterium]